MILYILSNKTISDVQQDFNAAYSFLKIEFYKQTIVRSGSPVRQKINKTSLLNAAGIGPEGVLEVTDLMTVGQLEKTFLDRFGIAAQVSRKSGILWLETTMTDNWTLKQQNDHGKELSEPVRSGHIMNYDGLGDDAR
jgi:hypothetical protein